MTEPQAESAERPMSNDEKRAIIAKYAKDLKRQEEVSVPGANTLAPKQALLDARETERKNPTKHVRWVSLKNTDKMLAREAEGYTIVPADRGGKRLGDDSVLMEISLEKAQARIAAQNKLAKDRLNQHKNEMKALAERLAKQLQDQGIDIDVNRLLVNEGA